MLFQQVTLPEREFVHTNSLLVTVSGSNAPRIFSTINLRYRTATHRAFSAQSTYGIGQQRTAHFQHNQLTVSDSNAPCIFSTINLRLSEKLLFGCVIATSINLSAIHKQLFTGYNEAIHNKEAIAMEMTIGKRIAALRREKNLKQDDLAQMLEVSPQAVSKWENDQTCPDISLLPKLAKTLGVSVDELLSGKQEPQPVVTLVPEDQRKDIKDMMLRIVVVSADGDKVRVNLPMALVQLAMEMGMEMPQVSGNDALKDIDWAQVMELVRHGAMGNLIEVESKDGDIVRIFVE